MSFLAPLYLAGLLAVSLPIVFHLIRRTPKGQRPFSSLMFLSPSPPRLAKRSRFEHLFLLLLRALALILIASAFARPFLRSAGDAGDAGTGAYRALLIDTSASMSRGDLWEKAIEQAEAVIDQSHPTDRVALITFDRNLQVHTGFAEVARLPPESRRDFLLQRLGEIRPSFEMTRLGDALAAAADLLETELDNETTGVEREVVLVTDLQAGSALESLEAFEWPPRIRLDLRQVVDPGTGNTWLRPAAAADGEPVVRIVNSADSEVAEFHLAWAGPEGSFGDSVDASDVHHVPPGESRVVSCPARPEGADRLVLTGDAHEFDNTLFIAGTRRDHVTVYYVGNDRADDTDGLRYYLERVFLDDRSRSVEVKSILPGELVESPIPNTTPMVVVDGALGGTARAVLAEYLAADGVVLFVLRGDSEEEVDTLGTLLGGVGLEVSEAEVRRYSVVGEIDFQHPLFTRFADPRFADFTRIHFWHHRRVELAENASTRVLARLDDGDPLLIEHRGEKGRAYALTSGWHPDDSELARSSRFPPLLDGLLSLSRQAAPLAASYQVGARVEVPAALSASVIEPGGDEVQIGDASGFEDTDEPGVYRLMAGDRSREFAVNLGPTESQTMPLDRAALEQAGIPLGGALDVTDLEASRSLKDVELEGRQRGWQWLVAVALLICILETWWAGRLSRRSTLIQTEAPA